MDFFKFEHVGEKIKLIAKFLCALKLFAIWATGLYVYITKFSAAEGADLILKLLLLLVFCGIASLISWFICLLFSGFGDLIVTNS